MEFKCEICNRTLSHDPDPRKNNNPMPENWHMWTFIRNAKSYRFFMCSYCTTPLRGEYHFSSSIEITDLEGKEYFDDIRKEIEIHIKQPKSVRHKTGYRRFDENT